MNIEINNETIIDFIKPKDDMIVSDFNSNQAPNAFIVSNIDSKTKGHERFADCYDHFNKINGSIKISILDRKIYRI